MLSRVIGLLGPTSNLTIRGNWVSAVPVSPPVGLPPPPPPLPPPELSLEYPPLSDGASEQPLS